MSRGQAASQILAALASADGGHNLRQYGIVSLTGGEVTEIRAVGVPVRTAGVDIAEVWMETSTGCVATLTASKAPTMVTPEIALLPDINGVCSVGGTLVISSNPSRAAITKMKMI